MTIRAYPYVESIDCESCATTGLILVALPPDGGVDARYYACAACRGYGITRADGKPLTPEEARAALCADA
jgi:hypothetical protein